MLKVPVVYIKDKQAFEKRSGAMRLLGSAVEAIKKLGETHELVHIIDTELQRGSMANFDIYDKLTYCTHIEVECENEKAIERLLSINARVVVKLPTTLPLSKWNKKLLVGKVDDEKQDVANVNDVLILGSVDVENSIKSYEEQKKRIMLYENSLDKVKKKPWAVILSVQ